MRPYDAPIFLSTLSLRRATTPLYTIAIARPYFYPRSPCGERLAPVGLDLVGKIFLSTLSLRRATCNGSYHRPHLRFLSTLSLRRATHNRVALIPHQQFLSTLSLRRATVQFYAMPGMFWDFYPRSPCGERRRYWRGQIEFILFLSTLSLRRATRHSSAANSSLSHFYPRSPCGERLCCRQQSRRRIFISIHALLAESDSSRIIISVFGLISIHALLAESDAYGRINDISRLIFLSTLSLRRATGRPGG